MSCYIYSKEAETILVSSMQNWIASFQPKQMKWILFEWTLWSFCISKILPLKISPNINMTETRKRFFFVPLKNREYLNRVELKITNQRWKLRCSEWHTTNRCSSLFPKCFRICDWYIFQRHSCFLVSTIFPLGYFSYSNIQWHRKDLLKYYTSIKASYFRTTLTSSTG